MESSSDDDEGGMMLFAGASKEQPPPQFEDDDYGLDDMGGGGVPARERAPRSKGVRFDDGPTHHAPARPPSGGHRAPAAAPGGFSFESMGQVQDLVNQNQSLQQQLEFKNQEIRALREQLQTAPEGSSDLAAKKIKELAKKNRDINLTLERERAKVQKMEREASAAEKDSKQKAKKEPKSARPSSASSRDGSPPEVDPLVHTKTQLKEWKEKYAQANLKLNEMRQELQGNKSEYMRMKRALQREVGDDVELSKVIDEAGNWRGRAQQVALLQQKVKNLKKQLENSDGISTAAPSSPSGEKELDLDDKHQMEIEKRAQARGDNKFELASKLKSAEEELQESRVRYDAASARSRTLEGEVRNFKSKVQVLLDKTDNDDKLIDAIRAELNKVREKEAKAKQELEQALLRAPDNAQPSSPKLQSAHEHSMGGGGGQQERFTSTQQVRMQEQHQLSLDVAKKESQALRSEMVTLQQKLRAMNAEAAKGKANVGQHNDLIIKCKLQEVEMQKVKEFCELVQGDISQADQEAVAAEQSLQEERSRRVALEKQSERNARGRNARPASAAREEEPKMYASDAELSELQLENRRLQREASLVNDVHARQRSVYESGIRELMRINQLHCVPNGSPKMTALIDENEKLRSEVNELRRYAR